MPQLNLGMSLVFLEAASAEGMQELHPRCVQIVSHKEQHCGSGFAGLAMH